MSDPREQFGAVRRPSGAMVAAGVVCAGMLALAVLVPPRQGSAAPSGNRPLVDAAGWSRLGSLQRGGVTVEILERAGERRYTVLEGRSVAAVRVDGDELRRRWGIEPEGLRARLGGGPSGAWDDPGPMMMVDPDAEALLGR